VLSIIQPGAADVEQHLGTEPGSGDPSSMHVAPDVSSPEGKLVGALRSASRPGAERALRDALHLDAVVFWRHFLGPMKAVHGADGVATFLAELGRSVDTWTATRAPGDAVMVLRGVHGDRLVATLEVRFEDGRAVGLLISLR
jgi:hypothetical protein